MCDVDGRKPIGEGLGFRFKAYVLWCFDGFERGLCCVKC